MVCLHTKANVVNYALFKKSHVNAMVISMLEILKIQKNGTTLPRCGPKVHAR